MSAPARLLSVKVTNFKALQNIEFKNLSGFNVLVGANGVGKSTFFGLFGFLKDCLTYNVRQALGAGHRGGYREVVTRGHQGEPIFIELIARVPLDIGVRKVTYTLEIGEKDGRPIVLTERLKYSRRNQGRPFPFIDFAQGKGRAIVNERDIEDPSTAETEEQSLDQPDILAIKGLGQFERFAAASAMRELIENWHVSDFHIQAAQQIQDAGYAEHLSSRGDNLPLVAQFMYEQHPQVFRRVLDSLARRVPGVKNVAAGRMEDGRIVLKFLDGSFKDPFVARFVSDGTIKMFAYLLLLNDPTAYPLLCVEEPENQLYPSLLRGLAEEFAEYGKRGQTFVSTHSYDFLDSVPLTSIYALRKVDGVTSIRRAVDVPNLKALHESGESPGRLWRQGYFEEINPE